MPSYSTNMARRGVARRELSKLRRLPIRAYSETVAGRRAVVLNFSPARLKLAGFLWAVPAMWLARSPLGRASRRPVQAAGLGVGG
jgi:hypothetical protein